jgi:sulfite exporter TauE/SafE
MAPYALAFVGGLAGSLHCIGMCGAFPLALAAGRGGNVRRQALYHLGRINTLVFIGAVSGGFGQALVAAAPVALVERGLALAAGLVMLVIGAEVLGWLPQLTGRGAILARATLGRLLGGVMRSSSPAAPLALGVFNAFLPCQLIYAFAAVAASTGSAVAGMLVMLAFGLGTVPAMLALGVSRAFAAPLLRARLSTLAGVLVLAFGALTMLRGFDLVPHGAHHAPGHEHHHHAGTGTPG